MPSRPVDRDTLVKTLRATRTASGGKPMDMKQFLADSGLRRRDVFNHFNTWNDLLRAAGYRITSPAPLSTDELLIDWARVVRKLKRQPTRSEYRQHGKYHLSTLQRRFKDWNTLPDAFEIFLNSQPRWSDVLPYIRITPPISAQTPTASHPHRALRTARRIRSRPACGLALDFGPLRHEPVNEQGVVFAFGMLAERLGFMVEAFQISFPDCQAKRRIPEGWQYVNIEFEYESRNFRNHRHNPDGCDIIVCWNHNWPDCPKNIEVIALKDEIKLLSQ